MPRGIYARSTARQPNRKARVPRGPALRAEDDASAMRPTPTEEAQAALLSHERTIKANDLDEYFDDPSEFLKLLETVLTRDETYREELNLKLLRLDEKITRVRRLRDAFVTQTKATPTPEGNVVAEEERPTVGAHSRWAPSVGYRDAS